MTKEQALTYLYSSGFSEEQVNTIVKAFEPTTKTCKTCRNYGSHNGVCDICKDYNCFTEPNKSEIPNRSTTKNDLDVDAVSRKAVLDMAKSYNTDGYDMYTPLVVDVEDIEELPSITPIRPKGYWIFTEGIKGKDNVEKCSCCGSHWKEAIIYRTDTQEYLRTRLLYCPNCGADMREVVEE